MDCTYYGKSVFNYLEIVAEAEYSQMLLHEIMQLSHHAEIKTNLNVETAFSTYLQSKTCVICYQIG